MTGVARIVVLLAVLVVAFPASAHSLRVFARVEANDVSGYAFFIGGGRPSGAAWVATMGGDRLASGRTDAAGAYRFAVPDPVTGEIAVTVDTGEGHVATARLSPERFGATGGATAAVAAASTPDAAAAPQQAPDATAVLVERAVERQVAPLLERIEAMDARLRLADVMSGVFLIVGLAGMALWARSWARSRRRS